MSRGKNPAGWFVFAIVRAIFFFVGLLPGRLGLFPARFLFRGLDLSIPRFRRIATRNLELAMPEWSHERRVACVDAMYGSLARHLWVVAKSSCNGFSNLHNILRIENIDLIRRELSAGRGLLFATGHLGAWELSAMAFGHAAGSMDVVARPLDNPYLDVWVTRLREQTGNRVLQKSGMIRDVLRALRDNRAVGFLLDQNTISNDACFVKFFGLDASTSTAFVRLAARSGAPVVPGFALWSEQEGRYVLRFGEPVPISGDPQRDTQAVQSAIEQAIRSAPEQWLWIHRRFKHRPEGQPSLYS